MGERHSHSGLGPDHELKCSALPGPRVPAISADGGAPLDSVGGELSRRRTPVAFDHLLPNLSDPRFTTRGMNPVETAYWVEARARRHWALLTPHPRFGLVGWKEFGGASMHPSVILSCFPHANRVRLDSGLRDLERAHAANSRAR
jgi:hypothetical protein